MFSFQSWSTSIFSLDAAGRILPHPVQWLSEIVILSLTFLKPDEDFPWLICVSLCWKPKALLVIPFFPAFLEMFYVLSLILLLPAFWFQCIWFLVLKHWLSVDWHSALKREMRSCWLLNFTNIPQTPECCLIGWSIGLLSGTVGPGTAVYVNLWNTMDTFCEISFSDGTLRSILLGSWTAGF